MDIDFSTLSLPIAKGKWRDADDRMFHACFVILGQFVEDELGASHTSGQSYRGYRLHSSGGDDEKAIDLWLWYKTDLPQLERDYATDLNESFAGKMITEDTWNGLRCIVDFGMVREPKYPYDMPNTVKDDKLRELIELRRSLWT